MGPANNRHAVLQGAVTLELGRQLTDGRVLTECAVLTTLGVRVPDVALASNAFVTRNGETTPFPAAPEICVEIVSPSNAEEVTRQITAAYLAAGAREVWVVSEEGSVRCFDAQGARAESAYAVRLDLPPRAAG